MNDCVYVIEEIFGDVDYFWGFRYVIICYGECFVLYVGVIVVEAYYEWLCYEMLKCLENEFWNCCELCDGVCSFIKYYFRKVDEDNVFRENIE